MSPSSRSLLVAIVLVAACALPAFLTASLAPQIREDFPFGSTALGIAFAAFWGCSALASPLAGRLAERLGPAGSIRLAGVGVAACCALVAVVQGPILLVAALVLGGAGNAMSVPGISTLFARDVVPERQGFAFGVGIAGMPAASLLAGLAVPLIGLSLGWRAAFAGAGVAVLAVAFAVRPAPHEPAAGGGGATLTLLFAILALGGLLGSAAAGSIAAFLVVAARDVGFTPAGAGLLLAVASALAVTTRLALGSLADRRRRGGHLPVVAAMLSADAGGYLLLSSAEPLVFGAGALLASSAGWGWLALILYAAFDRSRDAPAAATGILQGALYAGGFVGPLAFGVLADEASFALAWLAMAVLAVLGAAGVLLGEVAFRRVEPAEVV